VLNHYDKTAVRPKYIAHIAHGAAMAAAFCLLMPAAGLLARHRWIFTPADEVRRHMEYLQYNSMLTPKIVRLCDSKARQLNPRAA